jgi:hypothetical protein
MSAQPSVIKFYSRFNLEGGRVRSAHRGALSALARLNVPRRVCVSASGVGRRIKQTDGKHGRARARIRAVLANYSHDGQFRARIILAPNLCA